ncbi:MAG: glycosyltransferase family 39 protein [Burkholderiaceae bacterium]
MTARLQHLLQSPAGSRRLFLSALLVLTALRTALAAGLAFTGDEAYFAFWGIYPAWGYYDHPPMVGWWLAALAALSTEAFVMRLPALALPPLLAWIAFRIARRHGEVLGWNAATLTLLLPLNAVNVAITSDIPLMLFAGLCVWAWLRALRTGRTADFLLTGLMLAGALMSKYFAGLLALALSGHALWRPQRRRLAGLLWVIVGTLPAAVVQVAWNAQNCWPNVMFNLVNRHEDAGVSWQTPVLFVLSVLYVLTPPVAWRLLGGRRDADAAAGNVATGTATEAAAELVALRWLALVPLAILALLSLFKTIGVHWLASFALPAVLAFVLMAGPRMLARGVIWAGALAVAQWVLIAVLLALPTETYRHWKGYPGLVMTMHVDELAEALEPWRGRYAIASSGYSPAVTLGYGLGSYVFVFGPGSSHARHDDILTDLRGLAGKDILVVRKDGDYSRTEYEPFFDSVAYRTLALRGVVFHLIEGHGFRYEPYRDEVLETIRQRWYAVPQWLPSGSCYFCDRYFPERTCRRSGNP